MSKARDIARAGTALANVDATELGYLDGVTSNVQTQLDGKQAANANVSTTELGYLDGVTSAIQTQLDAKAVYPTQTGNSGKYLTTDGTTASWGSISTTPTFSGCLLSFPTTTAITAGVAYTLVFGTAGSEIIDTDNYHSTSTNTSRITIPTGKAGKYLISGTIHTSSLGTSNELSVRVYKNGNAYAVFQYTGSGQRFIEYTTVMNLAVNDYIELRVIPPANGNLVGDDDGTQVKCTTFGAYLLGI